MLPQSSRPGLQERETQPLLEPAPSHRASPPVKISDRVHSQGDNQAEPFASSRAAQVRAVASAFLRIRPWLIGPVLIPVTLLLWREGAPRSQLIAMPALMACMLSIFIWDAVRASKADLSERAFVVAMFVTAVGLTGVCALSGGVRSPLLPILLAPLVTIFAAFGPSRLSVYSALLLLVSLALLAAVAPTAAFPHLPKTISYVLGAGAMLLTTVLLYVSVAGLTGAYETLGVSRDELARERLSSAHDRMESLQLLSAKLAHELRNPLQSVKGLVELEARNAEGTSAKRLEVVLEEVARLEDLANRYLRYTTPISSEEREPVCAYSLAQRCAATSEARASSRNIAINIAGPATEIALSAASIHMALCNLVGNAIDASAAGGTVELRISEDANRVCFHVRDGGDGMTAEQLAKAGTPFATSKAGGTGLGLAITKQIAEAHGGMLSLESEQGVGTTATLTLPRTPWQNS